jgi:hypothetical protein
MHDIQQTLLRLLVLSSENKMPNLDINQLATNTFGLSASGYVGSRGTAGYIGSAGVNGAAGADGGGSSRPKITNIQVTDSAYTVLDDTAVDTAGGYIKISGTGFAAGCNVLINQTTAVSVTFVSSTEVRAQVPATTAGTYIVYLVNADGSVAIRVNGITFSATPTWTTSSTLPAGVAESAISIQLAATGASTYSLQAGSTLPTGLTLSNVGLIAGTVTGLSSDTTYNFNVLATDTELQDSPRTFSLTITQAVDPYFNYTTLLLSGNGTNLAQNNTFVDSSTNAYTITRNGNPTQGSFGPYGDNWSNYFGVSGDYLTFTNNNSQIAFGTGNFTIEFWVNFTNPASTGTYNVVLRNYNADPFTTDYFYLGKHTSATVSGAMSFWVANYSGSLMLSDPTVPSAGWNHFAIVRNGNTWTMYRNGTAVHSVTSSVSMGTRNGNLCQIGVDMAGYLSNLRVVKGTAVYTSNFTPSTAPLTPVANTVLLTCQSNCLIDNSPSNFAITRNGSASVQKFNPFKLATVTPTSYSNYFDGSGDVLTVPANNVFAFGTGAFCIEAWIYNNVLKNYSCLVTTRPNNGSYADAYHIGWDSVGGCSLYVNTTSTTGAPSGTIKTGQWQHFVCCRDSSNRTAMFVDGTRVGSDTVTTNFSRNLLGIGDFPTTQAECINGYISNLRLVKGSSVYDPTLTTITVPTGPLTTTSQGVTASTVSILTCQSNTFVDNSTNNFAITATGSVQPRTLNPFGYTNALANGYSASAIGGSAYLDGSGDYLDNSSTSVTLSASWTIECWFNSPNTPAIIFDCRPDGSNGLYPMLTGNGTTTQMNLYYSSADHVFTVGSFVGFWNHVAVVKTSGTLTIYFNGASVYSVSDSNTWYIGAGRPRIGANGGFLAGAPSYYTGHVSDLRVVNGTALYTSSFVPPTAPLTAVTNTRLLHKFTNAGIIDSAMQNNLETAGDAKISTAQSKFGGSSMLFDGTGDSLNIANSYGGALGIGNFTVEAWVYTTATSGTQCVYDTRSGQPDATTAGFYFGLYSSNNLLLWTSGGVAASGGTVPANTWTHIALVRVGNNFTCYLNGTSVGTGTSTNNFTSTMVQIGSSTNVTGSSLNYFNGYIDDLRVTKGVARYTGNFTPPTSAFAPK